jgi:hypothetical protein
MGGPANYDPTKDYIRNHKNIFLFDVDKKTFLVLCSLEMIQRFSSIFSAFTAMLLGLTGISLLIPALQQA